VAANKGHSKVVSLLLAGGAHTEAIDEVRRREEWCIKLKFRWIFCSINVFSSLFHE
jgi:hypothetical protein